MSSKRVKISFKTVNAENYTVIKKSEIDQSNTRIRVVMKDVVREYEKKEISSQQEAALLVLNA